MSAEMLDVFDQALARISRRRATDAAERFNALTPEQQRHNIRAWILDRKDPSGWVYDAMVSVNWERVLDLLVADDKTAIGDLVARELMAYGPRVYERVDE